MKYICTVCEYIYDPELGDPESGIEPGTAFEDIPDDWVCPICGVGKEDFEPYEGYLKGRCEMGELRSSCAIMLHSTSPISILPSPFIYDAFFSFTSLLASTTLTT